MTDLERPDLVTLLDYAEELSCVPNRREIWIQRRWQVRHKSPLYRELIDWFQKGWKIGQSGEARLRSLIEQADTVQGWTPLQWAAFVDRKDDFAILLQRGANAFRVTSSGRNVLHQAAESGSDDVVTFILSRGYHQAGLELDLKDIWGETPLHIAATKESESARLLIEHGASLDASQSEGQVPLTHTRYLKGQERRRSVELLSSMPGPHINAQDLEGRPPMFHLLDTHPCVELLIERGADIFIRDKKAMNIMHIACVEDRPETLAFLLSNFLRESQLLAEQMDDNGDTPLLSALKTKHVHCAKILLTELSIRTLKDKKGWSLLHHAVNTGDPLVLDLALCVPGITIDDLTNDGESAVDIAIKLGYKHDQIMHRLISELDQGLGDPTLQMVDSLVTFEVRGLFH